MTHQSRKNENEQLKNLLRDYFKTRSYFPYQNAIRDDAPPPSTREGGNTIAHHRKYNKRKPPTFEFATFCSMTSLHGFYHFVENNFNKIGKFFWAICLAVIYLLCGISITQLVGAYLDMSPIISLDNSASWIWAIPFPAVTVCSANRIRPSVYRYPSGADHTDRGANLTDGGEDFNDILIQNVMYGICEKIPTTTKLKIAEEYLDGSFVTRVLKNLSFPCEKTVSILRWMQFLENDACNAWFQETFTSYGLCYSFNMMPMGDLLNGIDEWSLDGNRGWKNYSSGWLPDSGYTEDALNDHLPLRTISNNDYYSVNMKLDLHPEDLNRECAHGLDVFYVLIHSPAEWPDRSHPTVIASVNTLETVSVKPIVLKTDSELSSLDPDKRKCYFQHEKKLKFFKVYTKNNCVLECRSNIVLGMCGCVPFYLLRMKNTPVCGPAKMSCWATASHVSSGPCGCLPGCTEMFFKLSQMKANFHGPAGDKSASMLSSVMLSVFYRNRNYIGFHRIMTSTFGQFIGNVGGIMGLCLGFSFLSLAEIIYFLTLRPLVNFCNERKKMKKVNPARAAAQENAFIE